MIKSSKIKELSFSGPLAKPTSQFLEDMRLAGRVYNAEGYYLRKIDETALQMQISTNRLPKEFVECWTAKRSHESHKTWSNRVIVIRKLAQYMQAHGMEAFQTPLQIPAKRSDFTPHIYTDSELKRIFDQSDQLPSYTNCPNRNAVASTIFRMIYGCGLRLSEALNLAMRDVDLKDGVLSVWESKFDKSRYVPMSPELTDRCVEYAARICGNALPEDPFFPAPDGGVYSKRGMSTIFRHILADAGIPYTGRGPRIHDLRHTFAVNCLKKWVLSGKDLNAALPVLSAYLGHKNLSGTQDYLRLTADMFPNITGATENCFGGIIPGKELPHEES